MGNRGWWDRARGSCGWLCALSLFTGTFANQIDIIRDAPKKKKKKKDIPRLRRIVWGYKWRSRAYVRAGRRQERSSGRSERGGGKGKGSERRSDSGFGGARQRRLITAGFVFLLSISLFFLKQDLLFGEEPASCPTWSSHGMVMSWFVFVWLLF